MIKEIEALTMDEKVSVWLHYMVTQKCLKHYWSVIQSNVSPLHDFIDRSKCHQETDYGTEFGGAGVQTNYSGIYYWYPRFKRQIFKKQKDG